MAAASGAPLDALRSERFTAEQRWLHPGRNERCETSVAHAFHDDLDEHIRRQARRQAAFMAKMPEVIRAAGVADRLRMAGLREDELEWLVPASYGWGEPGQDDFRLLGISMRIVEGIEHIYLGVKVQP